MSSFLTKYENVLDEIKGILDKISAAEQRLKDLYNCADGDAALEAARLQEQLKNIDEYLVKVRDYRDNAKRNLDSQNLLVIETYPGYRVSLNQLKTWAALVDPNAKNDNFAKRIYAKASCDEKFLVEKREECQTALDSILPNLSEDFATEIEKCKADIVLCKTELAEYLSSESFSEISNRVKDYLPTYDEDPIEEEIVEEEVLDEEISEETEEVTETASEEATEEAVEEVLEDATIGDEVTEEVTEEPVEATEKSAEVVEAPAETAEEPAQESTEPEVIINEGFTDELPEDTLMPIDSSEDNPFFVDFPVEETPAEEAAEAPAEEAPVEEKPKDNTSKKKNNKSKGKKK